MSHSYLDLEVLSEEQLGQARWIVHYRLAKDDPGPGDLCPELKHFSVDGR